MTWHLINLNLNLMVFVRDPWCWPKGSPPLGKRLSLRRSRSRQIRYACATRPRLQGFKNGLRFSIFNFQLSVRFQCTCSLHDRRFMSQAGRTRYFARSAIRARSARRGEEKNKAPVRSPLFLLFHQCWTVHQADGHADWSISTTWWWRTWSR